MIPTKKDIKKHAIRGPWIINPYPVGKKAPPD